MNFQVGEIVNCHPLPLLRERVVLLSGAGVSVALLDKFNHPIFTRPNPGMAGLKKNS